MENISRNINDRNTTKHFSGTKYLAGILLVYGDSVVLYYTPELAGKHNINIQYPGSTI